MKIVIDDQYHSDEDKRYTTDENGNIDLFINIGEEMGDPIVLDESNNINFNDGNNSIEKDFAEFKENANNVEEHEDEEIIATGVVIGEVIEEVKESNLRNTISSKNPWEDEEFSRNYNNIYAEIENNLEKKYAAENERIVTEKVDSNPVYARYEEKKVNEVKGTITVLSKLGSKEGVEIKGARINLYLLNGVSPKLYDSKFSDELGKVEFNNLANGCYRVIAIVDRRFFEKPQYYNWNEVTIDANNKKSNILVVNRIKPGYYKK
ncbi:MAG: calcium-binding protein [Clostridium sp.]|mgnify:CR=1 FL=1|uniref:calcium-binding protein n=1 Tax=Clostridium sp. TaxID=1506 RepID=UPI0025BC5217|nr:calcium-binding protein [Clostridium sp.]MCF0148316.1 calcium-binding protein [Clostridium sp.]